MKEALLNCHRYGVVVAASINNLDGAVLAYPGCYRNDWILCAQGSSRHPVSETDTIPERRCSGLDPLYGWGAGWPKDNWPAPLTSIDVSAPASHMSIIYSDSLGDEKPVYRTNGSGVSYAPPQVAGVAALMLSKRLGLSVDDLQGLMCASATDITTDYNEPGDSLPGWDKYTGWGRINADSCLSLLVNDPCHHAIQHLVVHGGGVVTDSTTSRIQIKFGGDGILPYGLYQVRRFEVRRDVTPPSGYLFAWPIAGPRSGWEWTGYWTQYEGDYYNLQEPYCGLAPETQHNSTCTLFSYAYRVWRGQTYRGWHPAPPESLDWGFGVLCDELSAAVQPRGASVAEDSLRVISAAPNPAAGGLAVTFRNSARARISVRVYDVGGHEVRSIVDYQMDPGTHVIRWDGLNNRGVAVGEGVYLCRVSTGEHYAVKKVILVRSKGD